MQHWLKQNKQVRVGKGASDNEQILGHKVVKSTISIKSYTTWGKFYTKDLINFQTLSVILTCRDTDNNIWSLLSDFVVISDNLPLQSLLWFG